MFELVILLVFSFSVVLLVLSFLKSRRNLEETRKKIEEDLEKEIQTFSIFSKEYIDSHEKKLHEIYKVIENIENKRSSLGVDLNMNIDQLKIHTTYSRYIRTTRVLQNIGRANRLNEQQPAYRAIWMYFNSGLVNSALKNVMYNDDSSCVDNNSVIGMLIGDKIKKDMRSYMFISFSTILSIVIPFFTNAEHNYYLISLLLLMFLILFLNHKVLGYRISNGLYGNNQYEAREIIGFIEKYSDNDFGGFDKKDVFPKEKHRKNESSEFGGILGGLLS